MFNNCQISEDQVPAVPSRPAARPLQRDSESGSEGLSSSQSFELQSGNSSTGSIPQIPQRRPARVTEASPTTDASSTPPLPSKRPSSRSIPIKDNEELTSRSPLISPQSFESVSLSDLSSAVSPQPLEAANEQPPSLPLSRPTRRVQEQASPGEENRIDDDIESLKVPQPSSSVPANQLRPARREESKAEEEPVEISLPSVPSTRPTKSSSTPPVSSAEADEPSVPTVPSTRPARPSSEPSNTSEPPPIIPSTRPARLRSESREGSTNEVPTIPSARPGRPSSTTPEVIDPAPVVPSSRPVKASPKVAASQLESAGELDESILPSPASTSPVDVPQRPLSRPNRASPIKDEVQGVPIVPSTRPTRPQSAVLGSSEKDKESPVVESVASKADESLDTDETSERKDLTKDLETKSTDIEVVEEAEAKTEKSTDLTEEVPIDLKKPGLSATEVHHPSSAEKAEIQYSVEEEVVPAEELAEKEVDSIQDTESTTEDKAIATEKVSKPAKIETAPTEDETSKPRPIIPVRPVRRPQTVAKEVDASGEASPLPEVPSKRPQSVAKEMKTTGEDSPLPDVPSKRPPKPIPQRPQKLAAAAMFEQEARRAPPPPTKPKPPAKVGKIGALQASLFKDLNSVMSRGGVPMPMPMGFPMPPGGITSPGKDAGGADKQLGGESEAAEEKDVGELSEKKLDDVRRGRAKGPRRKLPTAAKSSFSMIITDVWSIGPEALNEEGSKATEAVDIKDEGITDEQDADGEAIDEKDADNKTSDEKFSDKEVSVSEEKVPESKPLSPQDDSDEPGEKVIQEELEKPQGSVRKPLYDTELETEIKSAKDRLDDDELEEPAKVEPGNIELVTIEPVKTVEPVKIEPIKPLKVEPAKVEPVKVEPVKVEPVQVEPAKDPVKVKPPIFESSKAEPVKIDSVEADTVDAVHTKHATKEIPASGSPGSTLGSHSTLPVSGSEIKSKPEDLEDLPAGDSASGELNTAIADEQP